MDKLRLSRSKKTGGSKGYAFIEFRDEDDARIVADAMVSFPVVGAAHAAQSTLVALLPRALMLRCRGTQDKYLLAGKQLVVKQLPKSQVHDRIWQGADEVFRKFDWRAQARQQHNKV